jgi:hypothetical protein
VGLETAVEGAQRDVDATIDAIAGLAFSNKEILERTSVLWSLIRNGSVGGNLPQYARKLCMAVRQEFIRRSGVSIDSLLGEAASSNFWLARVKAIIERDILAVYQDSRKRLRTRLIEDETSLAEIASALPKIDERYHRTAEIYRQRMIICTVLSYVPGAGLLSSLWMTATMPRLQPLLSSDKPPYAQLGEFAVNVLLWAIIGNVVSSGMVAALLAVRFAGILSDGYYTAVLASLAIACSVALFLSIRNLQANRNSVRQRKPHNATNAPPPLASGSSLGTLNVYQR